jgi:hypothetical protein
MSVFNSVTTKTVDDTKQYYNFVYDANLYMIHPDLDEPYPLTNFLNQMSIIFNYKDNQVPYIVTAITVDRKILNMIQQDYNEKITFTLEIFKKKVLEYDIFDEPQSVYGKMVLKCLDPDSNEPLEDQNTENGNPLEQIRTSLVLFDQRHLICTKKNLNRIYHDTTIKDIISMIASNYNPFKPIINLPDNTKLYENVYIPSMPPLKAIDFLSTTYGIYKKGHKHFLDFNHCYIMDATKFSRKVLDGEEYDTLYVEALDVKESAQQYRESFYKDDENQVYRMRTSVDSVTMINTYVQSRDIFGDDVNCIMSSDDSHIINLGGVAGGTLPNPLGRRKKIYYSPVSNEFAFESRLREVNESAERTEIGFENIDIGKVSLEKKISLNYTSELNKEFKGIYRIDKVVHILKKSGEVANTFSSVSMLQIFRV